ncbi:hypothetical protein [Pseudoalteromonas sp. SWYJZ19]|uniref:hypothetical protein n=1 Tax=Pseudoalteromonas sp. SWYJZ19 TaxID=2792068 RepID=UPI0018CD9BB6|nr:hypothetical protein [Pseudoalteromonas sp. SWYJZ19]MBH0050685.1 hypothetical protein [Pseudoalteromonas sp. SWYJZ19]
MSAAKKLPEVDFTAMEVYDLPDRKHVVSELFRVRKEIALIEANQLKSLKERKADLENYLKATLEVGEKIAYVGIGSISMAEESQPSVHDWDALYEYIKENDAFYFLQRKLNAAPFRELLSMGDDLVGVSEVKIRKLSVRKN